MNHRAVYRLYMGVEGEEASTSSATMVVLYMCCIVSRLFRAHALFYMYRPQAGVITGAGAHAYLLNGISIHMQVSYSLHLRT